MNYGIYSQINYYIAAIRLLLLILFLSSFQPPSIIQNEDVSSQMMINPFTVSQNILLIDYWVKIKRSNEQANPHPSDFSITTSLTDFQQQTKSVRNSIIYDTLTLASHLVYTQTTTSRL